MLNRILHPTGLFVAAVLLLLCGACNRPASTYLLREFNTYFQHDDLRFSYLFPADYQRVETDRRELKETIRAYALPVRHGDLFAHFLTNVTPYHEQLLFHVPEERATSAAFRAFRQQLEQVDSGKPYVFRLDRGEAVIRHLYPLADGGYVVTLARSDADNATSMLAEYNEILASYRSGADYRQEVAQSPYKAAAEFALNRDSSLNLLRPLRRLAAIESNYPDSLRYSYVQATATYHSFLPTPELPALIAEFRARGYYGQKDKENPPVIAAGATAIEQLLAATATERLVLFNEIHFAPHHRRLVTDLLPQLHEQGFRYLALEALWEPHDSLAARGFPTTGSGFYLREPAFAELVRTALGLGFTLVPYEQFSGDREAGQARQLYERTFGKDPNAKVVGLAGFGHIHEGEPRGRPMMAHLVKTQYGIDPLTIDQTEFHGESPDELAIVDPSRVPASRRIGADLFLLNNYPTTATGQLQRIELPATVVEQLQKGYGEMILNVYRAEEYRQTPRAIPVANHRLAEDDTAVELRLSPGEYLATVRDIYGDVVAEIPLSLVGRPSAQ